MTRGATLAILLFAACGGGSEPPPPFEVVHADQRASLLSIWSNGAEDVWVVGGEDRSGEPDDLGPIVLHYDGAAWTELDTGERGLDLWWVHGFAGGPVFIGGDGGAILRYQDGAFERMETPGTATVFGLWGATADDVWAVGGNPGGANGGFAWRFDGTTWNDVEVPADILDEGTIWKISGRAADDIWMSGTIGYTGHFDGDRLERVDVPLDVSLFGISCNEETFVSAGGDPATIVENDGSGWVQAEVPGDTLGLTGVALTGDQGYVVGQSGTILRRDGGDWVSEDKDSVPTFQNLHAPFIDSTGGVWIAGGNFLASNTTDGVLLHRPSADE